MHENWHNENDPDDKTAYIVCTRVSDLHPDNVVADSVQMVCCSCQELILVAQSSLETAGQYEKQKYICMPCALPKMKPTDTIKISAAQKIEMLKHFSRNQYYDDFD